MYFSVKFGRVLDVVYAGDLDISRTSEISEETKTKIADLYYKGFIFLK